MANLFDPTSSCSPPPPPPPSVASFAVEPGDISSLLNTLLHNSAEPSTSSTIPNPQQPPEIRRQFTGSAVFSQSESAGLLDSPSGLNYPFAGAFFSSGSSERADNEFSCTMAMSMEGIGEVDYESEEQEEEAPVNRAPVRCSSKRSRAAEVHNLSEKRRRQRINEKMKALQKLIPNSNKTDKASMLDEAIEYLKQLQLQVQMLTMRNGSSLHPFYLPGVAQPVQPPQLAPVLEEGNSSIVTSFPANHEASMQAIFDLSSKIAPSDYKVLMTRMSENSNPGPLFSPEPSTSANNRSFNASMLSKVLCKDPSLPELQLDMGHCGQS